MSDLAYRLIFRRSVEKAWNLNGRRLIYSCVNSEKLWEKLSISQLGPSNFQSCIKIGAHIVGSHACELFVPATGRTQQRGVFNSLRWWEGVI